MPVEEEPDFVRVMPAPGLVVRGLPGGEVEILNAGSMVSNTHLRYGAWKWSKLSYRTGVGFTFAFPEATTWSADGALVARYADGGMGGRHSTTAVELSAGNIAHAGNLGLKIGQRNVGVESFVFWRAGWLLHVHHVTPRTPADFSLGGFALALADDRVERETAPARLAAWASDGRGSVLQLLAPAKAATGWDERLTDGTPRRHTHAPHHVTPVFSFSGQTESFVCAALSWSGTDAAEAGAWCPVSLDRGEWTLRHPGLGDWRIAHWALPRLSP